ncbi:ATP-binding protein [Hydrogenophaga sp.]|uniref:sensor histidine kinase n=1 Tax=Hydrogenophaga sp. TaxID=1904254 RepID=UPI002728EC80|nr:ATP-binding protein [Hydrogenophaga sp.]MDO8906020.1 ATP-binding protein [Hydrogenophaga sp.]
MLIAPLPYNEEKRLARLNGLGVLDTLPQQAFDDISALAQAICGTPIALITLIDRDRQWFKSRIGVDMTETPREVAFCSHAILNPGQTMMVPDMRQDDRFHDNPFVNGPTQVRFYAGAPIVTDDGFALGAVCVIDQEPRELTPVQLDALCRLSALVVTLLEHEKVRMQEAARTAEAVERQNEELTAMAVAGLDLLVYVDRNYVYQHVNDTFLEYWACSREQIVGRTLADLVGEQAFKDVIQPKLELALAGQASQYHRMTQFPGKGSRHVQVALMPARNAQGAITGAVMRAQDVHDIRQREAHLRETVALLEQRTHQQERFIHMLSHDFREPINAINNFSSLLESDHLDDLPASGQQYLGFVRSGGQRMGTLLNDLLRFMQLDKHSLATERVELHGVMEQVKVDLAPMLASGAGTLEVLTLPKVQADAALLRDLLRNLVANGLQFTKPGVPAHVRVLAERQDGFDLVHVEDNGIGVAPEHQEAVFDMLKRLHLRRAHPGSGLGLPIARRIASMHGGYLTMRSVPGEGSRFTLRLPLAHGTPSESSV